MATTRNKDTVGCHTAESLLPMAPSKSTKSAEVGGSHTRCSFIGLVNSHLLLSFMMLPKVFRFQLVHGDRNFLHAESGFQVRIPGKQKPR
jgi:hypothetical protein